MDINDLRNLLFKGKSEQLEIKADVSNFEEVLITACAMANTRGGHIVIGVDEFMKPGSPVIDVHLTGILKSRDLLQKFGKIGTDLDPEITTDFYTIPVENDRVVLVISVPKRKKDEWVSLKDGKTWVREGVKDKLGAVYKPKTAERTKRSKENQIVSGISNPKASEIESSNIGTSTGTTRGEVIDRIGKHVQKEALDLAEQFHRYQGSVRGKDTTHSGEELSRSSQVLSEKDPRDGTSADNITETTIRHEGPMLDEVRLSAPARVRHFAKGSDRSKASLDLADEDRRNESVEDNASVVDSKSGEGGLRLSGGANVDTVRATRGGAVRVSRSSDQLCLRVDDYAQVIADLLAKTPDNESMSFAVFGHWGRGKTFLMNRVIEHLQDDENVNYRPIKFSAWKYRTTPETWAYLFEQFLASAKSDGFLIPWRAGFERIGPTPLLVALTSLSVSLLTISQRINLFTAGIQIFGIGTILYFLFLAFRFSTAGLRLSSLYFMSGHSDKLGMQAAIGDDLRALLKAWIPRPTGMSTAQRFWWWGQFSAYLLLCLCITVQLWPVRESGSNLVLPLGLGTITAYVDPFAALVPYSLWVIAWLAGAGIALFPKRSGGKSRAILVVDDLDRCEPKQMLDIIESTLLILNDPEIETRMQIAMLIDDEAFEHALVAKYPKLLNSQCQADIKDDSAYDAAESEMSVRRKRTKRLIRENQEKFFLMQLRLPPLNDREVEEVFETLSKALVDGSEASKGAGASVSVNLDENDRKLPAFALDHADEVSRSAGKIVPKTESEMNIQLTSSVLSSLERDALVTAMNVQLGFEKNDYIGPRTIACLLHRYQLAREILRRIGVEPDPLQLADAIMSAYWQDNTSEEAVSYEICQVASQVS